MNNNENKILNVPHLRFPEFTGEWSKHRLGDVMAFKNGLNKGKEFFGTGTPIVNYMDVNKNENIVSSMIKGVVTVTNCEIENFQIIKGDVFFTRTSETSDEIGLSASLLEEIPKGVFSGFILRGRPISGVFEPSFSGYYFRSERIRKEIIKHSSITTRALTSGSSLSQLNISIPSLEEQSKIARLLELIDKKLDSQRKLIDLYKSLIKTLREKLFDHKSNNLLGNEINFINGYAFDPKTYDVNGKYYVCTISNVNGDRYLDLTQVNRVSEIPKDLNTNQQLFSGDILMSLTGNVGRVSIVEYNNGLLNQRVAKIEVKNKTSSNFIYHALSSEKFLKYVKKQSQGSSQNNIYYKNIEKFALPNFDSNKRLLSVLDKIDFLIINHSFLLQRLIGIKIFLLQNMFI